MNELGSVKNVKYFMSIIVLGLFISQGSVTARDWQAPYFQDHVLVGNIWDTHKQAWLTEKQFHRELLHYDHILLGETHNNPDHHILQAEIINLLVISGTKPTVVMEMLELKGWQDQPQVWHKQQELKELASMLNDGWPWDLYAPILNSVVQHRLKLYAGNVSSDELHRWSNEQVSYNINDVINEYSYTEDNFTTLKKEIIDSHCGHANEGFVKFMSRAQMQRDRVMATALLDKEYPVVFIAGQGHIRNDYAVPMQLQKKFKLNSFISVAFISVQEGQDDPQTYLPGMHDLYDVVYFTPNHTNEDPCEKFRKQLKNMHHRQTP